MSPRPPTTKLRNELNLLVASGPFLLAQGNSTAFEQLLRRAEEDSTIQTLILVSSSLSPRKPDWIDSFRSSALLSTNDRRTFKTFKIKRTKKFSKKWSTKFKSELKLLHPHPHLSTLRSVCEWRRFSSLRYATFITIRFTHFVHFQSTRFDDDRFPLPLLQ